MAAFGARRSSVTACSLLVGLPGFEPGTFGAARRGADRGDHMPKASKATASESVEVEGYEGHIENFEGGYTSPSRSTPKMPT